jgi:hypothetical protein
MKLHYRKWRRGGSEMKLTNAIPHSTEWKAINRAKQEKRERGNSRISEWLNAA